MEEAMSKRSILGMAAAAGALVASIIILGCNSSSPTAPYGGGGGGGGGGGAANTPFNSGSLSTSGSFDHTFPTAGTVHYHCNFHVSMGMVGTVVVATGGAASATVTGSGTSFSPSSVTIMPGGTVHWTISSGTHTVTSD
jgi:plastocyanin